VGTQSTSANRRQAKPAPLRSPSRHDWFLAISEALTGEGLSMAVQPIIDLASGLVVGYEALARFDSAIRAAPDVWFAMAGRLGFGPALEARALACALRLRPSLPVNCFLTANLTPGYLIAPEVQAVLDEAGPLSGFFLELTEHQAVDDYKLLGRLLDDLRGRGAKVAMDDAGSGYAGLQWLGALRPELVKLDRALVSDVDRDPTKAAMVEMLGTLTGKMDAWLLAEGIERTAELDTLIRLGVPLAQGYLFAKPSRGSWPQVAPGLSSRLRDRVALRDSTSIASLVEMVTTVAAEGSNFAARAAFASDSGLEMVVRVDAAHRPEGLHRRGHDATTVPTMTIKGDESLSDIAQRMVLRPTQTRWDPVVCVDGLGRYQGIVRAEVLVHALANLGATS
jgi:EAL domain-containing protein (putative c-di-GMP-specific phosphodiesterase class I)/CBS domain-containing protein